MAGVVTSLLVKPARGAPVESVWEAEMLSGHGIAGDCQAQALGPRQVLIVREESLAGLDVTPERVRANIATRGLGEAALASGSVLRLGGARVRVTHGCEVCKVLREYVPAASFALLPGRRGSLGIVLEGGPVVVGAPIHMEPERYPVVPEGVYERLAWVVARIPEGRVLTSDRLMAAVGAPRPYSRVLPTYLARARAQGLPAHRVLTRDGGLSRHLPDQRAWLAREGVDVEAGAPAGRAPVWDAAGLYR